MTLKQNKGCELRKKRIIEKQSTQFSNNNNLGEQPIYTIMKKYQLKSHDIVAASTEQLTHKMIKKACKGRRLTSNLKIKIRNAINNATKQNFPTDELFNY